jgi:hypothetical protein
MKTLKGSLLSDIDTTLAQGDEWEKNLKAEIKEFFKAISTVRNYESFGFKNGRKTAFFVPNVLKQLGYDANYIEIKMYTMDNFGFETHMNEWKLSIILSKRSDDSMKHINTVYDKMVYMDRWEFYKWNDVVKELIKPAAKSLDTFKKFLDNMEKWNEQLVGKQLLLK